MHPLKNEAVNFTRFPTRGFASPSLSIGCGEGMEYLRALVLAAIVLSGPLAASAAEAEDHPVAAQPVACLAKAQLSNSLSPVDLWGSIRACAVTDSYDEAVFQYALAGSFARFDALRVADESAHQAAAALPIVALGSLSEAQQTKFRQSVRVTLGDDGRRKQACAEVLRLGPPQYFPTYMVQHGLSAMRAEGAQSAFVEGFDATRAWPQAVGEYLLCP